MTGEAEFLDIMGLLCLLTAERVVSPAGLGTYYIVPYQCFRNPSTLQRGLDAKVRRHRTSQKVLDALEFTINRLVLARALVWKAFQFCTKSLIKGDLFLLLFEGEK